MAERVSWPTQAECEALEEHGALGGFFEPGMRWRDYLDVVDPDDHEDLELIREAIVRGRVWCTGHEHQNDDGCVPVVDGKRAWQFSFRGWGDLMAAIWSTALDRDMGYFDWYYTWTPEKPDTWPEARHG